MSSSMIETELFRCVTFQSLKSCYNSILGDFFFLSTNNSSSSQQKLFDLSNSFLVGKVKRSISESFHRWYFDAAGTTTTMSNINGDDPLILSVERLFESNVTSRLLSSLIDIVTSVAPMKHQNENNNNNNSNNSKNHLPALQKCVENIKVKYSELFNSFVSRLYLKRGDDSNENNNNNNNNNNQLIFLRLLDEGGNEISLVVEQLKQENKINNNNNSKTFWISADFPESLMKSLLSLIKTGGEQQQQAKSNNIKNSLSFPVEAGRFSHLLRSSASSPNNNNNSEFLTNLFKVLLRYSALSDEQLFFQQQTSTSATATTNQMLLNRRALSGTGQHSAVPPSVMKLISEKMGVQFECFASPLNSFCPKFCSAFVDTDSYFGSQGSFFSFNPFMMMSSSNNKNEKKSDDDEEEEHSSGFSFELNPPFVEDVMEKARQQAEWILQRAPQNIPVSFLIFLPHWVSPPTPCISNIRQNTSGFLKGELILKPFEHGYVDGSQHRMGSSESHYRTNHESVVFALQNDAGAKKWPFSDVIKEEIRVAFAQAVSKIPDFSHNNNNKNNNKNQKKTTTEMNDNQKEARRQRD
jgi:hypothetical protein